MNQQLHITNGDSAKTIMELAGVEGLILPWRDVLHDGPVPAGLNLDALSRVRAKYISDVGWASFDSVLASFAERDKILKNLGAFEEVYLWFEHDLYDQLQILQILDALAELHLQNTRVSIACSSDAYLGEMTAQEMSEFKGQQQTVSQEQLDIARRAWAAFRSADPSEFALLRDFNISALPFLHDAIERCLQEFPDSETGVSRTQMQILRIVDGGEGRPGRVFAENQKREPRVFMGDSSFWIVMNRLLAEPNALLALSHGKLEVPLDSSQRLTLTTIGQQVLAGEKNFLHIKSPDFYLGGVHCCADSTWCFDRNTNSPVKRYRLN